MFCGDDPTAKSSTLTCDSQHTFEDACVPVLYPGDQQDVARPRRPRVPRCRATPGAWVGLKIVTSVADGIGTVDLDPDRHAPARPDRPGDRRPSRGATSRWPRSARTPCPSQEALVVEHRLRAAQAYVRHNGLDRVVGAAPGASLGIVCAGKTYFDVVQALADLGVTLDDLDRRRHPDPEAGHDLPAGRARRSLEFADSVDEIVVIEEKRPVRRDAAAQHPPRGRQHRRRCWASATATATALASSVGELDPTAVADDPRPGSLPVARAAPRAGRGAHAAPAAAELPGAGARLLQRLPAQPLDASSPTARSSAAASAATGSCTSRPATAGMKSLAAHADGRRGRAVDRPGAVRRRAAPDPEHRRRHAQPLGHPRHPGQRRRGRRHHVQDPLQRRRRHDRRPGRHRPAWTCRRSPGRSRPRACARIVVCAEDPKRYGRRARVGRRACEVLGRDRLPEVQERAARRSPA